MTESNQQCSTGKKGCPIKCFFIPVIAVAVVIFVFEFLFHGKFMMPHYDATAELWRKQGEMLMHISVIRILVVSCVLTMMYCCFSKAPSCSGKCPGTGVKFGLMVGLLLGIWDFGAYAWMPVPMHIPLFWLGGDVVMGILVGVTLSMICRMCGKDKTEDKTD